MHSGNHRIVVFDATTGALARYTGRRLGREQMRVLAQNEGKLLTHPALLREVWGPAFQEESNYLHVHLSHLRRKIEPDPARPRYLLNQPGVGYRIVDPAEAALS